MLKQKELSSHEKTQKDLKIILLMERSQPEKAIYYSIIFQIYDNLEKAKL